jgi:hypothetical protein
MRRKRKPISSVRSRSRACRLLQELLLPGVNRIGVNRVAVRQINNTRHLAHRFQGYLRLQFRINLAFVHLVMVSSV